MQQYTPQDWYWLAADGRVFSSAREQIVPAQDADYQAWLAEGNLATPWPKDDAGNQTTQALQEVLTPFGRYVDLLAYAAAVRYAKETAGITVAGMPVATDRESQALINGAFSAAKDDSTFTTKFKATNGVFVPLDNATILALGRAVRDHVNACFLKEADVAAGIAANPPTIVSRSDVDAAFAGIGA